MKTLSGLKLDYGARDPGYGSIKLADRCVSVVSKIMWTTRLSTRRQEDQGVGRPCCPKDSVKVEIVLFGFESRLPPPRRWISLQ